MNIAGEKRARNGPGDDRTSRKRVRPQQYDCHITIDEKAETWIPTCIESKEGLYPSESDCKKHCIHDDQFETDDYFFKTTVDRIKTFE